MNSNAFGANIRFVSHFNLPLSILEGGHGSILLLTPLLAATTPEGTACQVHIFLHLKQVICIRNHVALVGLPSPARTDISDQFDIVNR